MIRCFCTHTAAMAAAIPSSEPDGDLTDVSSYQLQGKIGQRQGVDIQVAWCQALRQQVTVNIVDLDVVPMSVAQLQHHTKSECMRPTIVAARRGAEGAGKAGGPARSQGWG